MRIHPAWLALPTCVLFGAAQPPPQDSGSIAGVVRYIDTVPPAQKIMTTDGGAIFHNDLVVDPKTKGLRHVFLCLENAPARPKLQKAEAVLVDQRDMVFLPRVVAVQHGQAVRFENNDLGNHSVMANSTLPANQLNVIAAPGQPVTHVFEPQKNAVQIGCSLHSWMRAWVYVMPHPWFAVSDKQGKFQIKEVPPGKYTLWLRHPDTGNQERREIEIQPGKTLELAIDLKKTSKK